MTTLVFADAHVEPGSDLRRASALGRFIADRKPDQIIDLGDTFSLSSISGWDMSKRLVMEGRRYEADVAVAREFGERLFSPLHEMQQAQRTNKVKLYKPKKIRMRGNHEYRERRYVEQNPEMAGFIDIDKLSGYTDNFDVIFDYRGRYTSHGVNYMHCPIAGNDQPISGLHIPYKALQRFSNHIVMGHYHRSETASIKRTDVEDIQRAIVCPAFFDGQPHYLSPNAPASIDRGVVILHQDYDGAPPRIEEISLTYLYNEYL